MKTQDKKILPLALTLAALGLNLSVIHQVKAAGFVSASPMNKARNYHTATLLPNGKVLVAGGFGADTGAELYDPATDTWTVTGSLRVARAGACATLLPNGKVLVVAGGKSSQSFQSTASTELYDPAIGTWTLARPMKHARADTATATLLPNGKVLVADGGSSELYDPATGTWTDTGSMGGDLTTSLHTATLLPNGNVLGAGGTSSQLYDPSTGTWTTTGSLSERRGGHVATLLPNGKVLVAVGNRLSTAELYDPGSGSWSPTGSLAWDRMWSTATLLRNGQVLIAVGYSQATDTPISSGELYDPPTGTWTETAMNDAHFAHTATLLPNGKVLVAGGLGWGLSLLSSAELYEPDSNGAVPSITLLHHSDQIMSFSWSGAGTLEQADSLTAPNWQPAPIQANPQILSTTGAMKFFRVKD